ncbi:MAG: hypothetical protein AAF501_17610, partial [Pseudomonadota bacterium]
MMFRIATAALLAAGLSDAPRAAEASIVTLIVSVPGAAESGSEAAETASRRGDAVQAGMEAFGAEILRTTDPNDAELRSVLRRFAAVATNRDVALIYLDAPVVRFEDRIFVLPAGFTLDRATDLFTRAVPLSAFGRAAAVSGNGGAVFAKPRAGAYDLSESLSRVTEAPEPIAGG